MSIRTLTLLLLAFLLIQGKTLFAMDVDSCVAKAKAKVVEVNPNLKPQLEEPTDPANLYIKIDCQEASKINRMHAPYTDSIGGISVVSNIATLTNFGGMANALDIMTPYCRQNHSYFGTFCMAADIYSANEILEDPTMLNMLPEVVTLLARKIQNNKKVDFIKTLLPLFPGDANRAVTLASFLGLDDNGTQTMRLKASLLKLENFKQYATLFPYLTDALTTTDENGETTLSPITRVFFATRVGNATVPGVDPSTPKTYKPYAGVYLGCKMSEDGYGKASTLREIYLFGYSYEMIKLKSGIGNNKPIAAELQKYHQMGSQTGTNMRVGAALGYELCK